LDFFKSKWNNAFSIGTPGRAGKSIYATDYTQTINVHAADNVDSGTKQMYVPLNYGFVSHFRNVFDIDSQKKDNFFKEIKFDFEYILFFYDQVVFK
jgi:hypothetical protein